MWFRFVEAVRNHNTTRHDTTLRPLACLLCVFAQNGRDRFVSTQKGRDRVCFHVPEDDRTVAVVILTRLTDVLERRGGGEPIPITYINALHDTTLAVNLKFELMVDHFRGGDNAGRW
eukprot:COSAG06_NODE_5036_length_3770_cov_13.868973_4_plen_117_part_00